MERSQTSNATKTPSIGRRSSITQSMRNALRNILTKRPDIYRSELVAFLANKFSIKVSERSIGQTLQSIGWTRTTIRRIAQQRDDDL
ncbi:hypothetical protein RRF57_000784 [Xylaria bambusicola]|uniref:Transposase Tc1-like domain-containing protein n=1 Tax=Xylaria bambusicola TaxID=326684 RepID=A0AAN7UBC1_9PEZI